MEHVATCSTCGCCATTDLKPSRSSGHTNSLYCWLCRFRANRGREPTQLERDHHNGVGHTLETGCTVCHPEFIRPKRLTERCHFTEGWPGECHGKLLGWLACKMGEHNIDQIAHVEILEWDGSRKAYKFDRGEFNFKFKSQWGHVREIELLSRFVMRDGAYYIVEHCDGEYNQTGLRYVPPPPTISSAPLSGLGAIMKRASSK